MGQTKRPTEAENPTTLEKFRAAVRFLLITEHGMPELVADDLLAIDSEYVQNAFSDQSKRDTLVMEVASELAIRPPQGTSWVRLEEGQIMLDISKPMKAYLAQLVQVGLYGASVEDVAHTMLCRGIEVVLERITPSKRYGTN